MGAFVKRFGSRIDLAAGAVSTFVSASDPPLLISVRLDTPV